MNLEKIKVIIVDDHKIVRDGIASFTLGHKTIQVIGEAGDEDELMKLLERSEPDVVVMDISLPGKSGIELTEYLSNNYPEIKVLILSALDQELDILNSIKAGASGFLHKECEEKEFLYAIEKVFLGENYFSKRISAIIQQSFVKKTKESNEIETQEEALSVRELDVLKSLAIGCSDKIIADKLFISIRTVETHKKNIREKLKLNSTAELVIYAIKNNIIEI